MTEEKLKTWLQNLETIKTQIHAWNKCLDYQNEKDGLQQKSKKKSLQVELLTEGLRILDSKERFVIEIHLISKKTWEKTCELYEDKWGIQNGRSIRTLKRMQNRGLKKLLEFIKKSELEDIFADL